MSGTCEYGNEISGYKKSGEFLDKQHSFGPLLTVACEVSSQAVVIHCIYFSWAYLLCSKHGNFTSNHENLVFILWT